VGVRDGPAAVIGDESRIFATGFIGREGAVIRITRKSEDLPENSACHAPWTKGGHIRSVENQGTPDHLIKL
jgi:hypothetical protein